MPSWSMATTNLPHHAVTHDTALWAHLLVSVCGLPLGEVVARAPSPTTGRLKEWWVDTQVPTVGSCGNSLSSPLLPQERPTVEDPRG